jgi:hypothetical protein
MKKKEERRRKRWLTCFIFDSKLQYNTIGEEGERRKRRNSCLE